MKRIYISGPMTGLPENNYPAFNAAAAVMRERHLHVETPSELTPPLCGSWAGYMRKSVAQLITCDGILLLPGWDQSRGARIEEALARELGMFVLEWPHA